MARDLYQLGYKLPKPSSLKPKHVTALVDHWQTQQLSSATIKNRLGWVRWWAEKVGKASVIPRDNAALGIAPREKSVTNKAWQPESDQSLPDPRMQLSLELMAAFGLRLEEALKIKPAQADKGHVLVLQKSWTKGGRKREIPIRNDQQRKLLVQAREMVGTQSMIPADKTYIQHRKAFEHQALKHGITNVHGLRHRYAQIRYAELTGWFCPNEGGPQRSDLSKQERTLDRQARLIVSQELGHNRVAITKIYLG